MAVTISNLDGSGEVVLAGRYAPWPLSPPAHEQIKSEHQMIGGPSGPGDLLDQDWGWGPGRLKIPVKMVTPAILAALSLLHFQWVDGKRPHLKVSDGITIWRCAWDSGWQPERVPTRNELYNIELGFLIKEVL